MKLYSPALKLATLMALAKSKAATAQPGDPDGDPDNGCTSDADCLGPGEETNACMDHYCRAGRCVDEWQYTSATCSGCCPFPCGSDADCRENFNHNPHVCMVHTCEEGVCVSDWFCDHTPRPTLDITPSPSGGNPDTPQPTEGPTKGPTESPTNPPTDTPTDIPTAFPTAIPTTIPTEGPTTGPTEGPTTGPTAGPTTVPTTGPPTPFITDPDTPQPTLYITPSPSWGNPDTPGPSRFTPSPHGNFDTPGPSRFTPSPQGGFDTPGPSRFTPSPHGDTTPTNPPQSCGEVKSCSINPDPHYNIWSSSGYVYYDFQGGCDQYAIDNPILQVQIRTRPRNYYSTITQLAVLIKGTGEVFRVKSDGQVHNTITGTGIATYGGASNYHVITLGSTNPASYIRVYQYTYGLSMTAYGCALFFAGSEGMCGSFDEGKAREKGGVPFVPNPTWGTIQNALAQSWKVNVTDSLLVPTSDVCDNSSSCGPGHTFACNAVDRKLQETVGDCTRTCDDIAIPHVRDQCETDVQLSGDSSWACTAEYVNPVVAGPADPGYWCTLLSMSDEDLYNLAESGPLGDHCKVTVSAGGTACNYYVVGRDGGLPLTGSGCVDEDGGSCFYQNAQYDFLTQEERDSMCTTSFVANAAAQLRWGIENGQCMDDPAHFVPCPSDWEIIYNNQNLIVDFSIDSDHEITLDYDISVGRDFELEVFADCDTETPIPGGVLFHESTRLPKDSFHDKLIVAYDVVKDAIADSSLWNDVTGELQFCQRVSLVTPDTDAMPGMPVVTENTDLAIVLDLTVEFEFNNDVGGKANSQGGGSANFDSFVEAYKCNSDGGFAADPSPLLPNAQLFVCVRSLSTEVEIDLVESMTVSQDTTATEAELDVVLSGAIRNPSMTDWRYDPAFNGWVVSTRVPTRLPNGDRFVFRPEESVTVSGTVELELSTGRKLKLIAGNANKLDSLPWLDKAEKEASYEVKVQLSQNDEMEEGFQIGLTSASFFRRMWLVSTTTAIALIFAVL